MKAATSDWQIGSWWLGRREINLDGVRELSERIPSVALSFSAPLKIKSKCHSLSRCHVIISSHEPRKLLFTFSLTALLDDFPFASKTALIDIKRYLQMER